MKVEMILAVELTVDLRTFGASVKKGPVEFSALAIRKATASTPLKSLLASSAVKS